MTNASYVYVTGAQNAIAAEKVQTILEQHVDRLNSHAQNAAHLASRLHDLADRTVGARPAAEGRAGSPTPAPTHAIGKIENAHDWISNALGELANAVERLERL